MSLTAADISTPAGLPARLDRLGIHLTHGTDQDVTSLLQGVTHLGSLSLRGTPVTDAITPLLERYDLGSLDLVDTVTAAPALTRFRLDHPEAGLYPRTPPSRPDEPTDLHTMRA